MIYAAQIVRPQCGYEEEEKGTAALPPRISGIHSVDVHRPCHAAAYVGAYLSMIWVSPLAETQHFSDNSGEFEAIFRHAEAGRRSCR
jgi:hypothetical protein